MDCLVLRFDAPLMSFGGVVVDNIGVNDDWPSLSLLTGLFANAMGVERTQVERLQAIQDRLGYACRLDQAGQRVMDFQTVQLSKSDKAWTTSGELQGRLGGTATYDSPHLRYRDFWADRIVTLACYLRDMEYPALQDIADALVAPARPLFFGRKTCLPATPVLLDLCQGDDALQVLRQVPLAADLRLRDDTTLAALSSEMSEAFSEAPTSVRIWGERNWHAGVHGGEQIFWQGAIEVTAPQVDNGG